ncbi:HYR domain-containing protein [Christiangramia sp. LLG6405-1]|uniref:HYR domain-containing protein n=1 Tax=Christiangramia sp. LLG6405-1 TaxID=3160832 RepID=UPI00386A0DA3
MINAADIPTYRSSFQRKVCISLFLILFFSVNSFGQDVTNPSFIHQNEIYSDSINISLNDIANLKSKADSLIISADFNSKGELFILTFGNGIHKVLGNNETKPVIDAKLLFSPLDFAIDSKDRFYVGNVASNNRKILVFDVDGTPLPSETIGNGNYGKGPNMFKGPTGLAFDNKDNLYVADNYSGTNGSASERGYIKVFFTNGNFTEFHRVNGDSLNYPYRIAANNDGRIFVSEVGPDNGRVQVIDLDPNLDPVRVDILEGPTDNIGSPGSINVDEENFIYIADFGNDVSLKTILEARNEPLNLVSQVGNIQDGIRNEVFKIRVYNHDLSYKGHILNEIDLPVDLALGPCNVFGINNLNIEGGFFSGFDFDFDLEIYKRTPGFYDESPVLNCPEDLVLEIAEGENEVEVIYSMPTAADQDNVEVEIIAGPESGERKTEGDYNVVFEATDLCGNKARCAFKITVNGSEFEDTPPEFENCSPYITKENDTGECGAAVVFDNPTASDESGNVEVTRIDENIDLVSGSLFPVGNTTITFQANDGTNDPVTCSFDIVVEDNQNPEFLSCPTNFNETVPFGQTGKVINYVNPTFDDNCPGTTIIQNAGLPTGSEFPVGSTTNTFVITDKIDNTATCTFTVTITEEAEDTPPEFDNCSPNITEENDPGECGAVVNFDLPMASDESGSLRVTKIDNSGLNSGDLFPVGRTTITFQANDGTNDPVTCNFDIVVQDTEAPRITCPSDFSVPSEPGQNFAVVDFNTPTATDNCGIDSVLQTQGLVSGSQFNVGSHTITFEATDVNGLTSECSFEFEVLPPNFAPSIECPADISVNNDSGICGAIVEFEEPTVTDPEGDDLSIIRTDDIDLNSGDIFPVGTTTLSYEVSDGINEPKSCSFTITVENTEEPNFTSCPNDISELLEASATGKIITFDLPQFEDNCSEAELFQTEGPTSGEFFEVGETEVRFELRVDNTVVDQCSISVNLVRQTTTFQCIESITINLGEDAQNSSVTEIPTSEFILSDSSNLDFELNVQQFTCEDIGTFELPIRATDRETGENFSCTVEVTVKDVGAPLIICPAGIQEREIPLEGGFVLPQVIGRFSIADNCDSFEDLEIVQDPPVGTVYREAGDYDILFTATDSYGNTERCEVTYRLTLEQEPQEFALNCPQNESIIKADENCQYIVPDFSNTIIYSPANANFSQSIPAGTRIEQSTSIEINVSFNGEFDSCTFDLVLKDNTSPMLRCPEDRMIVVAEGESIAIPDYRGELEVSDNCGLAEIIQDPAPGTQISENTEVSFIAFDISNTNNASECSFMLTLAVDTEGNDIPIANEDFYSTPVNTTLNISAEEGVLANDMDADGDELTATLVENVTNGTLEFESDGSFVYTPDDGFIGDDSFIYYVFDGFTEVETTVTITVVPVDTGEFQCVETYVLELDENGTAQLQINELYTGDASGVSFSLDQEIFDCDDLGTNQVTLSYTGVENGSCEISIEVVDRIKPEIEVQNIGIDLDLSGNATITPEDVIVSFSDNCDNDLSYELSRSAFSCKDLGWNEINLIATDASGNSTTTAVEVQVFAESGICNGTAEGSEYIFIYPNPNRGNFKVATPADVTISRIEVFDHRGRFITGKDYPANALEYAISTGPLQEAVYVVKMITSEGEKTKRFIIKN